MFLCSPGRRFYPPLGRPRCRVTPPLRQQRKGRHRRHDDETHEFENGIRSTESTESPSGMQVLVSLLANAGRVGQNPRPLGVYIVGIARPGTPISCGPPTRLLPIGRTGWRSHPVRSSRLTRLTRARRPGGARASRRIERGGGSTRHLRGRFLLELYGSTGRNRNPGREKHAGRGVGWLQRSSPTPRPRFFSLCYCMSFNTPK